MILNSESAIIVRRQAERLVQTIKSKEELLSLVAAQSFEEFLGSIEHLLLSTNMYFDEEYFVFLNQDDWKSFKALLLVYALNSVNKNNYSGS